MTPEVIASIVQGGAAVAVIYVVRMLIAHFGAEAEKQRAADSEKTDKFISTMDRHVDSLIREVHEIGRRIDLALAGGAFRDVVPSPEEDDNAKRHP